MYTTVETVRIMTGFQEATPPEDSKISDETIELAIKQADSIINGKIGDRYQLPLASTPYLIESISSQIAKALLYAQEYGEETENLDKGWQKTMDYFVEMLDDIQLGKTKLRDDDTGEELARSTTDFPSFYPNEQSENDPFNPTFSRITVNRRW